MRTLGRKLVPDYQWSGSLGEWAGKAYRLRDLSVLAGRPGLKVFLMEVTAVANVNGGFRPFELLKVEEAMLKKGLKRIVGLPKWSHGGAQGARSMGYLYFHSDPENFIKKFFKKFVGDSGFTGKLYHRAIKFACGEHTAFVKAPRMALVDMLGPEDVVISGKGVTKVSRNFAVLNGISPGDKLEPLKSSVMLTDNNAFDIYYSEENNKLKLPVKLLSKTVGLVQSLKAVKRNSNLLRVYPDSPVCGRWVKVSTDIQRYFGVRDLKGISRLKELAAGLGTKEDYEKLLRYKDKTGKWMLPGYAVNFKTAKEFIDHPYAWKHILKTINNSIFSRIRMRMRGGFCVALPAPEGMVLGETVYGFRSPIILPVKMCVKFVGSVCYVDRRIWEGFFAGDYDGDLFTWFSLSTLPRLNKLFGTNVEFLDFTGDKIQIFPKYPVKVSHKEDIDERTIEMDGLGNYSAIGRIYGRVASMMDTAAIMGMPSRARMILYMDLVAEEMQTFVDGIKYDSKMDVPSLYSLCRKWKLDPAIALGVNWMRVSLSKGLFPLQQLEPIVVDDSKAMTEALKFQMQGKRIDPDYEREMHVSGFLERFAKYKQGFYFGLYDKHFRGIHLYKT